jgi:DNA-binding CsgD family transcriptional regulator
MVDTARLLEPIRGLLDVRSREELFEAATQLVGDIVPTDGVRIAELTLGPDVSYRVVRQRLPAPDPTPSMRQSPLAHPIIAHYHRTRFQGWVSMQELLPGRAWTEHPLYRDVYRPLGLRAHIACALHTDGTVMHSLSLNRGGRDFSAGERAVLNELRRIMATAWRHVDDLALLKNAMTQLALDNGDTAVAVIGTDSGRDRVVQQSATMAKATKADSDLLDRVLAAAKRSPSGYTGRINTTGGSSFDVRASRITEGFTVQVWPADPDTLTLTVTATPWIRRSPASRPTRSGGTAAPDLARLTKAERHVVALAATGARNIDIADELFLSVKTVEAHLSRAYRKLGLRNRTELARAIATPG